MLEDIKPDMIIIGYVVNDAQYCDENGILIPAQWVGNGGNDKNRWIYNKFLMGLYVLFPNIERKIESDLDERDFAVTEWPIKAIATAENGRKAEVDHYYYFDWELKLIEGDNLERYKKVAVEPLGKFIKDISVPCILMTLPHRADYEYFHVRYKDVMPLFMNAGIPVYDCLDDLLAKHSNDIRYNTGISPVNDWLPYNDRKFSVSNTDEISPRELLNPSVKDNTITFTYSDEWENNKYLYLPMNAPTVKLCFANPVSAKNIIIRNSDGSLCNDFTVWEAHIGGEGFEEFNTNKLASSGDGKYNFTNEKIISLNLHRSSQIHGEKIYTITFE